MALVILILFRPRQTRHVELVDGTGETGPVIGASVQMLGLVTAVVAWIVATVQSY